MQIKVYENILPPSPSFSLSLCLKVLGLTWVTFVYIHRVSIISSLPVYLVIRVIVIPRALFIYLYTSSETFL